MHWLLWISQTLSCADLWSDFAFAAWSSMHLPAAVKQHKRVHVNVISRTQKNPVHGVNAMCSTHVTHCTGTLQTAQAHCTELAGTMPNVKQRHAARVKHVTQPDAWCSIKLRAWRQYNKHRLITVTTTTIRSAIRAKYNNTCYPAGRLMGHPSQHVIYYNRLSAGDRIKKHRLIIQKQNMGA